MSTRDRIIMAVSFLAIHTVWGSTYLAIHYAVLTIPPLVVAGLRHVIGGTALLAWCWSRGHRATAEQWRASLVVGALFFLIGHGSLHWAELVVPSGVAALLVATEPVWVAGLGSMTPSGSRLSPAGIAGLLLGIAGVALLVRQPELGLGQIFGCMAVVGGAFSWSVGMIYSRSAPLHPFALMSAAMSLVCGGCMLLIASLIVGTRVNFAAVSTQSWIGLAYLAVFGSATFAGYCWLLTRVSPVLVATHTYSNPIIAVLLGAAIAGERITPRMVAAAAAIPVSILLVKQGTRERPRVRLRLVGTAILVFALPLPLRAASLEINHVTRTPSVADFADMTAPESVDGMTRVEGFISRVPKNGVPVSERTVAYVGYDNTALYVAFVNFDRQANRLRARLVNRDLIPSDDDTNAFFLDTFHDRKRCYGFQINGRSVQNDAIWTEGGSTWDFSFDAVWHSEAKSTDQGYVALFAVPFKSLRFPPRAIQEWGIFLYRGIPRKNEEAYWPEYSSSIAGRLNQEGDLHGLESVSPGRNLQFIPYTSFLGARTPVTSRHDTNTGVDAKMIIRDSLVADVTVNPDFSQVESDEPQETVNQRFEVFFPEKRPFFIENASYFDTPLPLLFTRRVADPQHGVKLTGKTGSYGIGVLAIDDRSPGELAQPGDPFFGKSAVFRALRITHDILQDSNVGGIYVERSIAGTSNRVAGADTRLRLNQNWFLTLQGVTSKTGDISGNAYRVSTTGSWTNATYQMDYDDLSDGFRADAGFITRVGIREVEQTMSYRFRPQNKFLLSWGPDLYTNDVWDHAGGSLEHSFEPKLSFELPRQTTIAFAYQPDRQRLIPREFPTLDEPLALSGRRWGAEITTSVLPRATLYAEWIQGTSINFVPAAGMAPYVGSVHDAVIKLEMHPSDSWTWQNTLIYSQFKNAFTHRLVRSKISYQFSRALSFRVIVTSDHLDSAPARASLIPHRGINGDFLISYLLYPGTALYLGYNTNYSNAIDPFTSDLENDHRQLFIKASYLVRF